MERSSPSRVFFGTALAVLALDIASKFLAHTLLPARMPQPVLGTEWLRLTLVYNRGAAFGIHLGHEALTRIVFIVLTLVALVILWRIHRQARNGEVMRVLAVGLVAGGALGNLIDRLRWSRGVVDFVDVGVGAARWPTFNIADMAVTMGAIALALVLWREERSAERARLTAAAAGTLTGNGGESPL
jgi:signal peptidase II